MNTENTIGICNKCNAQFPYDDPHIGYLCDREVIVPATKPDEKDRVRKCDGVVVRHKKPLKQNHE